MVIAAVGGQILHAMNGGGKDHPSKKWLGIHSGVGLIILLIGGFGMLARLGTGIQPWLVVKIVLWLALGFVGAIAIRKPEQAKPIWLATIGLTVFAAYLAVYKPF